MFHMFFHCYSLKIIIFPENLEISKVTTVDGIFSHCISLVTLNLSNFYLSNNVVMHYMFHNCNKLKYIDLSNFPPITLTNMRATFRYLSSLVYLNIPSIEINSSSIMDRTYEFPSSFLKVCSKQPNMIQNISNLNIINDCEDICFNKNIKIGNDSNECISSCKDNGYDYEYINICFHQCPDYTHAIYQNNDNNALICLDKNPEGYYLDNDGFYKKCFESCKFCYGGGNEIDNKCSICKTDYYFFDDSFYKNNCYKKCPYYYYDENNKYICSDICSDIYDKLIINTNKCIDKCENDNIYKYEYNKICYKECQNININNKEEGICFDTSIFQFVNLTNMEIISKNDDIYQGLLNNFLLNYDLSKEEDMVIQGKDNYYFHITNSKNDLEILNGNNNKTNKFSVIDLGECEDLLKDHYHINKNGSLLIMKFEKITNISSERALQYEIYNPYNKEKLNLSICINTTIDVYTPIILSEKLKNLYEDLKYMGYDLFDINSPFYQDICTPYTTNDGTDVSLTDRVNYYFNNEETVCQSNCKFSKYLVDSQYLKCECDIMNSEINIQEITKLNAKVIYKSFYNVLKYSNYKVLHCYKLAFSFNSFTINIESIISIIFFFIFFICFIIYILKGKHQLITNISIAFKKNLDIKKYNKKSQFKNKIYIKRNNKGKSKDKMKKSNNNKHFINSNKDLKLKIKKSDNLIISKRRNNSQFKNIVVGTPPKKNIKNYKKDKLNTKKIINNVNIKFRNNNIMLFKIKKEKKYHNSELEKIGVSKSINRKDLKRDYTDNKKKELLDYYELNNLDYLEATKLDKRNFIQIYWSLLKREHPFIFTFITKDDYNITMIKHSRFIFLLCTDMAMNVFFFSDETMHKMFLDYGKYNFIQQIPQIIYSTLLSKFIETSLCFLSMTDIYYYQIKDSKNIDSNIFRKIINCVKIKIVYFFIFTILVFCFYWYLITCFCAVYQNTQIVFIKDSLSSFLLDNAIPFLIYFFTSLFRLISLKTKASCSKCIYQLSKIIPCF